MIQVRHLANQTHMLEDQGYQLHRVRVLANSVQCRSCRDPRVLTSREELLDPSVQDYYAMPGGAIEDFQSHPSVANSQARKRYSWLNPSIDSSLMFLKRGEKGCDVTIAFDYASFKKGNEHFKRALYYMGGSAVALPFFYPVGLAVGTYLFLRGVSARREAEKVLTSMERMRFLVTDHNDVWHPSSF